ncbi:MAG: restriction endonuclease subunit S [Phycisphaerae bacterium]
MRRRIDELVDIQLGYQFRERLTMASDGTHQVIQVKDINQYADHQLVPSNLYRVTPVRDAEKYVVRNGDVLFLSKGRRNSATLVEELSDSVPAIAAGYFFILRPQTGNLRSDYLAWAINAPPAQAFLQSVASGSAMPFVTRPAFESLEIDVPSLDRQRAIVELHRLARREHSLYGRLAELKSNLITELCLAAAKKRDTTNGRTHVEEAE